MTEKLSPCPFCGSQPVVELGKVWHCQLHGEPSQAIVIRCKKHECHANPSISGGDIYNGGKAKAKREAATRWNTRADTHTELVEALEDVLLQFDSCTVQQDNLKTKIRQLVNKATKEK